MMAEHAAGGRDDDIFVYTGGEQVVPRDVTRVIVDKSVKIIRREAFYERDRLVSIEMHDGIEIVEEWAFCGCTSLRGSIKLPGVRVVEDFAFESTGLTDVEFGDKLETIGYHALRNCRSLRSVKMPTVREIDRYAFDNCDQLTDVEMPDVERIGDFAFFNCIRLRRIAIPLKDGIIAGDNVFNWCENLSTVNLGGGIYKTISSLHLESWRNGMREEIDRINRDLPTTNPSEKTSSIRRWIRSVLQRIEHYKTEHCMLLKEAMTLLELALWKAKLLDEKEAHFLGGKRASKRAKINDDDETARTELRITSGASDVITNVLSFLVLE
jgi:hypothetical protein